MLARLHRIVDGNHLRVVSRKGQSFRCDYFVGAIMPTGLSEASRFGFIVSKQVGGAVVRNIVKRRLRALAASSLSSYPHGFDIVVRAQPASARASFPELSTQWQRMMDKVDSP